MGYNTRRKSLSLPSLGITLPNTSRASSHRQSLSNATSVDEQAPAPKKVKRSHTTSSVSPPSQPSPPRHAKSKSRDERPKSAGRIGEQTPPPSPGRESGMNRIDTEGISDEIVVGVIEQLENTGNRPHLLKELAAVLGTKLPIVQSSANPSAIISSRLTNYIKRPWTALAPCPVGKELVGTHPKRIYFFLTTSPHQPIPDQDEMPPPAPVNRIISPSISSQADEEERDARTRSQMSPSPEVDLSTPELEDDDDPMSPAGSFFSGRNSISRETAPSNMSHSRRAQSPPLERDEREFTQTASSLQQQRRTQSKSPEVPPPAIEEPMADLPQQQPEEETEESAALRNSEAAAALFGHDANSAKLLTVGSTPAIGSSPMIKPQQLDLHINTASKRGVDEMMEDVRIDSSIDGLTADWMWSELKSPENVDLEELDDLFADC